MLYNGTDNLITIISHIISPHHVCRREPIFLKTAMLSHTRNVNRFCDFTWSLGDRDSRVQIID
eukprot:UN07749